jgi:TonB-linked SusC/RagA family outer membrane protein
MAGVIVITTKKGRPGASNLSYVGEFTYRLKPSYNEFNIMNSQDQMDIYKELNNKGWLNFAESYRASNSGVYGKMYQLINTYDKKTGAFALQNTSEARNTYLRGAEMRNTDWFDYLFNDNVMQSHSVSISSGTEKASFYASLSAVSDPGWTLQSQVERYTGNFNLNYNISNKLSLNLISMGSYRKQKAPGTLGQTTDVVSGEVKREFDINPYSYALNSSRTLDPNTYYTMNYAPFNILNELANNYIDINATDLKFQGELKWKVLKSIELAGLVSYSYKASGQEHNITNNSNQAMTYRAMGDATIRDKNSYLYKDPDNPYALPITVMPQGGMLERSDYKMNSLDSRLSFSWVEEFNEEHIVNFYGGAETNSTRRGETWFSGVGVQYDLGKVPFFEYEYFKKLKETGSDYYKIEDYVNKMAAFFGSATYSYEGKYSFNLTGRYEGTNKMGRSRKSRWLPTWNVGVAWNVHEESFFKHIENIFSHLNVKASYSLTGEPVPEFVSNSSIIIKSYVPFRPFAGIQESGLQIESLENSELTYEKKNELNIGTEMGFLKNRISFVLDWYTRNNYDLIGLVNTQGVGGQVLKYGNVADMASGGVEFTLSTKNIVTQDFDWSTNFIFGKNYTKITQLDNVARVIDLVSGNGYMKEGYPVRALFSIQYQGLDENGVPTFLKEDGSISSLSNPEYNFQNRVDLEKYLKYEGPTDPTMTGSLGNLFRYKDLKLNVRVTYSLGNVIRLDPVFKAEYSDLSSMTREFKNRWMVPGDENKTNIPVIISQRQYDMDKNHTLKQTYNAYNYSDIRIAKGDFIRLKEISLVYDFPKNFIEQVSALSLKLQATNLFLLYADKKLNGQDPEFFRSGGVATPVPKQFTLTLRASF